MTLSVLIIDDEPIALQKLARYVRQTPYMTLVGECGCTQEALEIMEERPVDVIFTDIDMPDQNGIDFIESLPVRPLTVFITAYPQYALEGYRLAAVDYLLKPYGLLDFQRAASKVRERHEMMTRMDSMPDADENISVDRTSGSRRNIFVKVDYRYVNVMLDSILFIKGCGEYLHIEVTGSQTPLLTLSSFAALKGKLSQEFLQVHRSYMVNMSRVCQVTRGRIIIGENTEIPIGDSYKTRVSEYLRENAIGIR